MPHHVDQIADKNGAELVRLSKLYTFPEFVKAASLADIQSPQALPKHVYADPVRNQFPCNTAAGTWVSALYYQEKRAEFHPKDRARIEERLSHYADYWQIAPAVTAIRQQHQALHKNADDDLPDSSFAMVWNNPDTGRKERSLRLKNTVEVKAAADWLVEHRDEMPYADRHEIAKKILEKAAAFGANLKDKLEFVERQAGRGVCDPSAVVSAIEKRAYSLKNDDLRKQFLRMAATVKEAPSRALQPQMLIKLAETLDELDRRTGLFRQYADGLERPEDVIFSATFTKAAAELQQHVATTSGRVYDKGQLTKIALTDLRELFGDEFAERVRNGLDVDTEKLAEEIGTLPRGDAALIENLLSDVGVMPVLTKAASSRQGFSREEQIAIAKAYATI